MLSAEHGEVGVGGGAGSAREGQGTSKRVENETLFRNLSVAVVTQQIRTEQVQVK